MVINFLSIRGIFPFLYNRLENNNWRKKLNNPITILLASLLTSTGSLTSVADFDIREPVIEREVVEEDVFAMYRQAVSEYTEHNSAVLELYDRYEKLVREEAEKNPEFSAELCLQAVTYGAEKHQGQQYKPFPYIYHPISVALILIEEGGVKDHYVLAAAALHDTIEDTDATGLEIQYLFGKDVASIVKEVTNPSDYGTKTKHEWQLEHVQLMSDRACLVKTADRIHNLRSFNRQLTQVSTDRAKHIRKYFQASMKLAEALSGHNDVLDEALQVVIDEHFKLMPTIGQSSL